MLIPVVNFFRTLNDPFRNAHAAGRWIASLPAVDALSIQKEALDLVAAFPGPRREVGPGQVEALLRIDARLEPVLAQLTQQYTVNYQKSTSVESRLWHAAFDLVKAFTAAYQLALKAGYPRADNRRWRAVLPWVLVRLAHFKGMDGKYRLFRYGHWIPAQWREFHELYEFARMRGWQREQLVFGAGTFSRPGVYLEGEYLKTLLLMRLDSGNFTPDQVEWVAKQLEDWAPSLTLVPPPGAGATFLVDLTGTQGLRRLDRPHSGGRILFLDASPAYTRIVERMRWLPEQDDVAKPGELPAREQRLLLMRLASLFGPEAIAHAPRSPRFVSEGEVRVVIGLQALTRAVAEIERLPEAARTPAVVASYDEITQMVNPSVNPESVARRVHGSTWKMADRSESGWRLVAAVKDAPARLGEIVAIRDGDAWSLAVVRRMQRHQVDEVTVGVEVIARRLVRVLLRTWVTPTGGPGRPEAERPFFGLYLPAHPENRQASQRSLIGPDDKFVPGGMVELDTGGARYLIRFTQTLERQAGWAWALFSAVRKLSA